MREIIFDTETTGFDPHSGDRMVEIGCIEMIDRLETGNSFHCYYNPQRPMPKAAEEIHGLSDIFLSDKMLFADGADELLEFLGDANLVAHNAQFDFNFLNAELVLCGKKPISQFRMIDTLAIAKVKHPGAKLTLDALCSRYGIDRSHRIKHGALLDAELLTQLYIELTGGRQIGLSLSEEKADAASEGRKISGKEAALRRQFIAPRAHEANEMELARHAAFMKEIEDPLWAKI
ncbi:DNA polymerase III subunit epsilon [Parasphingorhabdus sp. JC815]|uniref:DNA polymerase III subunit epsilon n=1 Tax=Parasphingorhabdus sp. JC815 TaxID=3232140 RepID=UPI00345ABA57